MLTDRIKYAMDHLSHKQHISLLARPNWRRTQTRNAHILVSIALHFLHRGDQCREELKQRTRILR